MVVAGIVVVVVVVVVGVALLLILVEWLLVFHNGHKTVVSMGFVSCSWD